MKVKRVNVKNPTKRRMGDVMAEIRESIKRSQEEAAKRAGKSQQTISRLEQLETFNDDDYAIAEKALGVDRDYIDNWQGNTGTMIVHHIQDQGQAAYNQRNYVNTAEALLKQVEEIKAMYKEQIDLLKDMLQSKDADIAKLEARIDKLEALIAEKDQEIKALLAKLNGSK